MSYEVRINTSEYKSRRASRKNWEPATMNAYMSAVNGWTTTEPDLEHVKWRLMMFQGNAYVTDTAEYQSWKSNPVNIVRYYDQYCEMEREQRPSGYGFMQGYFNVGKALETLKETGYLKVPFKSLYDSRQYIRNMDGCYMEIKEV